MASAPRDMMKELSQLQEAGTSSSSMSKKRKSDDQSLDLYLAKQHCEFAIAGPHEDLCQALAVSIDDALCDDALAAKNEKRARAFTVIPGL